MVGYFRRFLMFFPFFPLACGLTAGALAGETLPGPVLAEVLRVVDGDTLVVRAQVWLGHRVETLVRVSGVDAPERKARCAEERVLADRARVFVEEKAAEGHIWLSDIRFGKYAGRVLARVRLATGADLSEALLAAGLARTYAGGKRQSWCKMLVEGSR